MDTKHYHEREFSPYWSEVTRHPSLVSTRLDHCQGHVRYPQASCLPSPPLYLSFTMVQSCPLAHYFDRNNFSFFQSQNSTSSYVRVCKREWEWDTYNQQHSSYYKKRMLLSKEKRDRRRNLVGKKGRKSVGF